VTCASSCASSNFRRLLAVRLLSQGADGVYQVALATYVVFSPEKQTSAGAIASAMAVLLLPYSLIGPFAGVLLDRWRRRQVFLYGNLLRALLAALTAVLMVSHVPDWLFYVSALCVTAVNRFVLAGLSAALPRVVDDERLVSPTPFPHGRNTGGDRRRRPRLPRTAAGRGHRRRGGAAGSRPVPVRRAHLAAHGPELLGPDRALIPAPAGGGPRRHRPRT
jgi:hypothetical protein